MKSDADNLWKALVKEPENTVLKLALADCLAESGYLDTAAVLQWCVAKRRWPKRRPRDSWRTADPVFVWSWGCGPKVDLRDPPLKQGNGLPFPFYKLVDRQSSTLPLAIVNITKVLTDIRDTGPKWH